MHAPSTLRRWSLVAFCLVWCAIIVVPVAAYTLPAGVFPWFGPKTAVPDINVAPLVPDDETYHQKQFRAVVRDMKDFRVMREWDVCKNDTGIELWYANHADKEQKTIEHYAKVFRGENVTELILSLQRNIDALHEQIRRSNASHAETLQKILESTGIMQMLFEECRSLVYEVKIAVVGMVGRIVWSISTSVFWFLFFVSLAISGCILAWKAGLFAWTYITNPMLAVATLWTWLRERVRSEAKKKTDEVSADLVRRQTNLNSTATPTGQADGVSSLASQTSTLSLGSPRTVIGERDSDSDEETEREGASSSDQWHIRYARQLSLPPGGPGGVSP